MATCQVRWSRCACNALVFYQSKVSMLNVTHVHVEGLDGVIMVTGSCVRSLG